MKKIVIYLSGGAIEEIHSDIPLDVIVIDRDLLPENANPEAEHVIQDAEGEDVVATIEHYSSRARVIERIADQLPQPANALTQDDNRPSYTYRVCWEIDVEAPNAELAARRAELYMPCGDESSLARTYTVFQNNIGATPAIDRGAGVTLNIGDTCDDFENAFGPILMGADDGLAEYDDVKDIDASRVWTVVEGDFDGELFVTAGWHLVNKIGYVVTEKPWITGTEQFQW